MTEAISQPETTVSIPDDEVAFRDLLQMTIELCHELNAVEEPMRPKPLWHATECEQVIRTEEVLVGLKRLQGELARLRHARPT